jgi:mRNA interferase RelE/StbE
MAEYRIEFLKTAEKELAKLPKDIQQRVRDRINLLMINPYPSDVKKLKNGNGRLRTRVGNYRIIYTIENDSLVIVVIKIGHRSGIYN